MSRSLEIAVIPEWDIVSMEAAVRQWQQVRNGVGWIRAHEQVRSGELSANRLTARAAPDGPNQIWLQDITYVPTAQGWWFLALVMDLWSRKIVGWAMADHLRSELVVSALQMAQTQRQPGKGLLVHSDRGVQYASQATRDFLAQHGWIASMSRSGNPYDNAWMESAIGKIKSEVLGRRVPANHGVAKQQLFVGIECWYNHRRRHSSLGYQSPVVFESQFVKN